MNEYEAERILGGTKVTDPESARVACGKLLQLGIQVAVVITLGSRGCVFHSRLDACSSHVPARRVAAVDSTGAGDSFLGSMVHFLAGGSCLAYAIDSATLVASISVMSPGCQPSYPDAKALREAQ